MVESDLLTTVVEAAEEKKADNIVVLNVQGLSSFADYFVICHGNSVKQVQAIAREIKKSADKSGIDIGRLEGFQEARWILLDLGNVVVHVFHRDEREHYNLERLWGDAPREKVSSKIAE